MDVTLNASATEITVTSPPMPAGTYDLQVVNSDGSSDTAQISFLGVSTEGQQDAFQTADQDHNNMIETSELLRIIQFYNSAGYHCADTPTDTEDGYVPGPGANHTCAPYDTDYNPQDWIITLNELLRAIQFYNARGYYYCPGAATEDGFCPGP